MVSAPAPPRGFATFSDYRACASAGGGWGSGRACRVMLGGSLRSGLLRGVGGSRGQFGARGVREGGAAMAAGESMAQRMVWVDLEVSEVGGGRGQASAVWCEPVPGERRGSGSPMRWVSASRERAARGRSGAGVPRVLGCWELCRTPGFLFRREESSIWLPPSTNSGRFALGVTDGVGWGRVGWDGTARHGTAWDGGSAGPVAQPHGTLVAGARRDSGDDSASPSRRKPGN